MRFHLTLAVAPFAIAALVLAARASAEPVRATGSASTDGEWVPIPQALHRPPNLSGHAAVYDSLRDRLIVFGGNDVWAFPLSGPPIWQLLAVLGTRPAPRSSAAVAHDPLRDRLIVHGGRDGSSDLDDVWSLDLSEPPKWTQLAPGGSIPLGRAHHSMVYDPLRDRMIIFGGVDYGPGTRLNDAWALDLDGSTQWSQILPTGTPPAPRYGHAAIYDPVRDRMVIYAGVAGFDPFWDLHALSLSGTPAWSVITPTNDPPYGRRYHAAVYDAVHDDLVIYGGDPNSGDFWSDTWSFDFNSGAWDFPWVWGPGKRTEFAFARDSRRNRLVVTGGRWGSTTGTSRDCWALKMDDLAWSLLSPIGPELSPAERSGHAAAYDAVHDRMLMHGGTGASGKPWGLALAQVPVWDSIPATGTAPVATDHQAVHDPLRDRLLLFGGGLSTANVPELSLAEPPRWSTVPTVGSPTGLRRRPSVIFDPLRDRILMFGGFAPNISFGVTNNSLWQLSLGPSPTWVQLAPLGPSPPGRGYHTAIYDQALDRMVVFGGFFSAATDYGPTPLGDVWALSVSGTPTWIPLYPTGTGPGLIYGHTAVLDDARRRMLVWGIGTGGAKVWSLSLDPPEQWTELLPVGGYPPSRSGHVAVFDPDDDRMVVFGGKSGVATLEDLWELRFSPPLGVDPPPPGATRLRAAPNPSLGRMRAVVTVPDARGARLELFDLTGRRILRRELDLSGAGPHVVELPETDALSAGVYLMRLIHRGGNESARALRIR